MSRPSGVPHRSTFSDPAMSIDGPRVIVGPDGESTGLYHYSRSDGTRMWAIGYCSSVRPCPEYPDCATEQPPCDCGGIGLLRTLDICSGHLTPEEATAHYTLWCFDNARYDGRRGAARPCSMPGCVVKTRQYAIAGGEYPFCTKHLNRQSLGTVMGVVLTAVEPEDAGTDEVSSDV